MKKTLMCFLAIIILLTSCTLVEKECEEQKRLEYEMRQQERNYFILWSFTSSVFWINVEIVSLEDGSQQSLFYEGKATQRLINMYNYILYNQEPQIFFNNRDIVMNDIFETPNGLSHFWGTRDMALNGLLNRAFSNFMRAWNNGYIDPDDVDGCWRGHGDWSEEIDERIAERNRR